MAPDRGSKLAAITNACYFVRHYARGGRSEIQRPLRAQAIQHLALVLREALSTTDDPEPYLAALLDGLRPRNDPPF